MTYSLDAKETENFNTAFNFCTDQISTVKNSNYFIIIYGSLYSNL